MDRIGLDNCTTTLGLKSPLDDTHEFYVLIETAGSQSAHDEEKISRFLEKTMENGLVENGTYTADPSKGKVSFTNKVSSICTPGATT